MRINRVIKTFIVSDFFVQSGFSVFAPIFAIFVTKQIANGSLEVVGFAAAISQIVKVTFQIPVARILDKNHGEYDDFYSLITGSLLMAIVPFLYLLASESTHLYIIQGVYGLALAFLVPPWYAIFSRHLDKNQENIEWSFESVTIGIASATAAALGGIAATRFGFQFVFIIGGLLAIVGSLLQIGLYHHLRGAVPRGQVHPQPSHTQH